MKNILYKYIGIAMVVGAISACQPETLDLSPIDQVDAEQAFSTPEKIQGAVIGVYDGLQSAEFLSGRALIYVDVMGEDVYDRTGWFGDLARFTMLSTNAFASNVWTAGYGAIARANRVIEGVTDNADVLEDPELVTNYIAEAKFARAVAYFYLVNYYGQTYTFTADGSQPGVPLITTSFDSNDPEGNQPRSSVAEIYQFIISELTACLTELPADYGDDLYSTKTLGTQAAAAALLSRVYLYMGDYDNAKTFASDVMTGKYGAFALNNLPDEAFAIDNYQTDETIWSIPNNSTDNPNTNNALPQHYYGRADLPLSKTYLTVATNTHLPEGDYRRTMMSPAPDNSVPQNLLFTTKYTDILSRADWAPVIRYAEIILNFAEATTKSSQTVTADAVNALNSIRDRAKAASAPSYTTADFASADALVNAILEERRVELAFEGHRFWDLMRNKKSVKNKYAGDGNTLIPEQPFGDDKNIFPIPSNEVDKSNGVLVQNPGY